MNARFVLLAALVPAIAATTARADIIQTVYQINSGGEYTFLPSPESPGISGGIPNAFKLVFGIGGTFAYELDTDGPTARLLHLNLNLTGNDAIQATPPSWATVTADGVEEYLASHTFVEDFIGGLLHLESSTHQNLKLTDGLNGELAIRGGFDATPIDGLGWKYDFSAVAVPSSPGDTNVDGIVNAEDLNNVRNHFGGAGIGDAFPFDGKVDVHDLNAVRNNFGNGSESSSVVPEPSAMGLMLVLLATLGTVRIACR